MLFAQKCALVSGLLLLAHGQAPPCPDELHGIFADMHDGDKKEISISAGSMTIKPSGNKQKWIVKTEFDVRSCSANVDFNVPGKPGVPPVNLTATLWSILSSNGEKTEFEFTDPSGTLAAKDFPLNRWVELVKPAKQTHVPCQKRMQAVYADMHDGDKKEVILEGEGMTIKPYGNNQTWIVKTKVDRKTCSAVVDFNVPGKPGPPPVNLTATFLYNSRLEGKDRKTEYEFTDPTGTLAAADFPLNHWVEISRDPVDVQV
jgi:hypothetical protein